MAHPEIRVQDNAIDAIVAAAQQILIESAQPICHGRQVTATLPPASNCPAGATFFAARSAKKRSYFPAQKARFRTTVQRIWGRGPAGRSRSPPARCEVSGIGITGWAAWPSRG